MAPGSRLRHPSMRSGAMRQEPRCRALFTGADVAGALSWIGGRRGYPKSIRINRRSDFISRGLDLWACARGTLDVSRPGEPADNTCNGGLRGKGRADRLSAPQLMTLTAAPGPSARWGETTAPGGRTAQLPTGRWRRGID